MVTREPGGTPVGEKIRDLLLHKEDRLSHPCELALFLASRAEHVEKVIKPALEKKRVVLCDRFNDSSAAYQGSARGLGIEEVLSIGTFFSEGLVPDLTFYLDLDPEIGLKRGGGEKDRIEREGLSFHKKVREGYLTLAELQKKRFCVLDATKDAETVFLEAKLKIESLRILR